jgi:hypothetical protein
LLSLRRFSGNITHAPTLTTVGFRACSHGSPPRISAAQQLISLRSFRCGVPAAAALGVVDKLHEEAAVILPADGRGSRHFWEVLEFTPDGAVLETWKTPDVLGLVRTLCTLRTPRRAARGAHGWRRHTMPAAAWARRLLGGRTAA